MITRECFIDLSNFMTGLWKKTNKELLSCFKDGEDGLFETLAAYTSTNPVDPAVAKAMEYKSKNEDGTVANPDRIFMEACELSLNRAFLTLWDRGALTRLLIDEEIPEQAQRDLNRIVAAVEAAQPKPVVVQEVVVPVAPIDPVEVCVREFHEMGSNAFKVKYLTNQRNRPIYEAAIDRGLL